MIFGNSEIENHKQEVKEKWGETDAYKEYTDKTKNYSKNDWQSITDGLNEIFADFSICMKDGKKPDTSETQALVTRLQNYITEAYYTCTNDILANLGKMYVYDERFKNNIDKNGDGTATFISEAIDLYCKKRTPKKENRD